MEDYPKEGPEFTRNGIPVVSVEDLNSSKWRDILDWYAYSGDPWEISVVEMAQKYQQELESLDGKNLELSGRMVLTCSVILRAKAEGLIDKGQTEEEDQLEEDFGSEYWGYEEFENEKYIPDLEIPLKRINKRTVTRDELSDAFTNAVDVYERREERWSTEEEDTSPDWGLNFQGKENFQVKLQRLYRKVKEKVSRGKEVLFSRLLNEDTKEEKFRTFMELLHLQSEGKIICKQEEPFSEIEVELREDSPQPGQREEAESQDE